MSSEISSKNNTTAPP